MYPLLPHWRYCSFVVIENIRHAHGFILSCFSVVALLALQWRHNDRDGVPNHQPYDCLLKRLFRCRSKKTSKLRVTGLCEGNSSVIGEFPAQRASNAEFFPSDDVIVVSQVSDVFQGDYLYCRGTHIYQSESFQETGNATGLIFFSLIELVHQIPSDICHNGLEKSIYHILHEISNRLRRVWVGFWFLWDSWDHLTMLFNVAVARTVTNINHETLILSIACLHCQFFKQYILSPVIRSCTFKFVIFKHILVTDIWAFPLKSP